MPTDQFVRSLNFILSNEQDKALDAFINLLNVDTDTLELHIILGNVYRQRGEIDKATHIHNSVLGRINKTDKHWSKVSLELGRDYFQAGMFDRAENIFKHIADSKGGTAGKDVQAQACKNLMNLYEIEKNWVKAIEPVRTLISRGKSVYAKPLAHYYCELADSVIDVSIKDAYKYLNEAANAYRDLPRLLIIEGDIKFKEGINHSALSLWTQSLVRNSDYTEFILPRIKKAFGDDKEGFADYISGFKFSSLNTPYIYLYLQALLQTKRHSDLIEWLQYLADKRRLPRVLADSALDGFLAGSQFDYRAFAEALETVMNTKDAINYRCSHCGFVLHEHYWHCVACYRWDTAVLSDELSETIHPQ